MAKEKPPMHRFLVVGFQCQKDNRIEFRNKLRPK
jgi:hypothetical protein